MESYQVNGPWYLRATAAEREQLKKDYKRIKEDAEKRREARERAKREQG